MSPPLPKDPRHQRFADLVLDGQSLSEAYRAAGFQPKGRASAHTLASRMRKRPDVSAYIDAIQAHHAENAALSRQDVLAFLCEVIKTPIGEVDEKHQLAQEFQVDEVGEVATRTKVKMPGKIDAAKLLISMMGWNAPAKVEHSADDKLAGLLRSIRTRQKQQQHA